MGSRSTHIASQTGGLKGRVVAQGDILISRTPSPSPGEMAVRLVPEVLRPSYSAVATLRILHGPQQSAFSERALGVLATNPYRLTSRSDRMGYRLEGAKLTHAGVKDWISDGTVMGALQVPPDEQPILLMADCQTTGGYPKIAVVISVDLHLAGQLLPGDTINFRMTTLAEAQAAIKADWHALDRALPPFRSN
jgi:antagonist of KipI